MIYSHEVEMMCPVAQGVNHGCAPIPEEAPIAVWESVAREVVDLAQIDFNDAEFVQEITDAAVDKCGVTVRAVIVERKRMVDRVCLRLALEEIPKDVRKKMRVHPKNFVFRGEEKAVGVQIPYTQAEYAALSSGEKKRVLLCAERVREYALSCAQLVMLRILKTDDAKVIEKIKKLFAKK